MRENHRGTEDTEKERENGEKNNTMPEWVDVWGAVS